MSMYKETVTAYNAFTDKYDTKTVIIYPERSIRYTPDEKYFYDEEFKSFCADGLCYRREFNQLFMTWKYYRNDEEISKEEYYIDRYFTMTVLGYSGIEARKIFKEIS